MRTVAHKEGGTEQTKSRLQESFKKKWESKVMHGQYIRSRDRQLTGEEDTSYGCQVGT